ncbi:DUF1330 domain-containing protein [Nocardioides cheoyonin]|uniref:DUF1330 domain-containing protein n=1 Tax=Nocardioides cheoyonin TaxID=3156615 RepID=UPI0032B388F6
MPAYVISEVRIRDERLADTYMKLAAASIARHGGRYIVRGAEPLRLESWYASDDYAEALSIREDALDRRLLFVPGIAGA